MIRLISPIAVLCHCIVNLFTSFSALCLIRQLFNTNNGLALWVLQQSGQCSGSSRHYYSVCLHVSVWEITHHIDQDNRLNLTTAIIKQAQLLSQNHNKEIKILFKENDTLLTIIHISNIKVIHSFCLCCSTNSTNIIRKCLTLHSATKSKIDLFV